MGVIPWFSNIVCATQQVNWVAVGGSGKIAVATNPTFWERITSPTSEHLYCVCWDGTNFVAGGANGTIIYSPNGRTWTQTTISEFGSSAIRSIASGLGKVVAVGDDGRIAYSSDNGATWTGASFGSAKYTSIAFDGSGMFVLSLVASATFNYSTNGTSFPHSDSWNIYGGGIAHNGSDLWLAVGGDATASGSPSGNGVANTSATGLASSWSSAISVTTAALKCAIYDGSSTWVVAGKSGKLYSSADAASFTSRTSGTTDDINCITYDPTDARWVYGTSGGKLFYASSVATWTEVTSGFSSSAINGICHNSNALPN